MEAETEQLAEPPFDYGLAQDCDDWDACYKRHWLPPLYTPGTCFICDELCDLREPGTTVAYSVGWPGERGVPMEVHINCTYTPVLKGRFIYSVINRVLAEIAMQVAWQGARRFDPPEGY